MPKYLDTSHFSEKLELFEQRFTNLLAQYQTYGQSIQQAGDRIRTHQLSCLSLLQTIREEQEAPNKKKGIARWFAKRNQGKINAKILGLVECQLAILQDLQDAQSAVPSLLSDAATTIKRDVREVVEGLHLSLKQLDDQYETYVYAAIQVLGTEVEVLKELAAREHLTVSTEGKSPKPDLNS
jgi:hypothetical protein